MSERWLPDLVNAARHMVEISACDDGDGRYCLACLWDGIYMNIPQSIKDVAGRHPFPPRD